MPEGDPEAVESLLFFRGLKRGYMLTQATSERGGLGPHTLFQMGRAAMLIDGRSPMTIAASTLRRPRDSSAR